MELPTIETPQKCIAVLWPSFMLAVVATGLFFSAFNPAELYPFGMEHGLPDLGVYTIGFLLFWVLTAVAGSGTFYFTVSNCRLKHRVHPQQG